MDNSVAEALPGFWKRLWRATIWHRDAIPPEEHKYRQLKRVYLPLYDGILVAAGLWATAYGSPVLHRLFSDDTVDVMGMALAVAGMVCFSGIAIPSFWLIEFIGKTVVIMLLGGYAGAVTLFRTNPDPSAGFIVFILALGLIPPFIRLTILGEEIKERRAEAAAEAAHAPDTPDEEK